MRRTAALVATLILTACRESPPALATPESAWQGFAQALRTRDARTAWESLSTRTRGLLGERARAISAASGGIIQDDARSMLLQSGVKPAEVTSVRVVEASVDRALLEVVAGGRTQKIPMVREADRWLVELTEVLVEATKP